MEKYATKKAVSQLQKFFKVLGKYGGSIESNDPWESWILDVEVEEATESSKDIMIGVCTVINGDVMYDPLFYLTLNMDGEKIVNARINGYESHTLLARLR